MTAEVLILCLSYVSSPLIFCVLLSSELKIKTPYYHLDSLCGTEEIFAYELGSQRAED